jgi:hypothetical protein
MSLLLYADAIWDPKTADYRICLPQEEQKNIEKEEEEDANKNYSDMELDDYNEDGFETKEGKKKKQSQQPMPLSG